MCEKIISVDSGQSFRIPVVADISPAIGERGGSSSFFLMYPRTHEYRPSLCSSASSGKVLKYAAEDFCCQATWKSRRNAWLPFKALPRRLAAKRPASYFRFLPDEALGST